MVKLNLNLEAIQSAKTQIIDCKQFFTSWFQADLSSDWKFISILYADDNHGIDLQNCQKCQNHVIIGTEEFSSKLDGIIPSLKDRRNIFQKNPEEFKILAQYLLYCTNAVSLPVRGNYLSTVKRSVALASDVENIKIWAFLTPEQRVLLQKPRIVFQAPWGSGKTLLMVQKALELAEMGEKVLYVVYHRKFDEDKEKNPFKSLNDLLEKKDYEFLTEAEKRKVKNLFLKWEIMTLEPPMNKKSLLTLALEEKLNHSLIQVKPIFYELKKVQNPFFESQNEHQELKELMDEYENVIVDEYFSDILVNNRKYNVNFYPRTQPFPTAKGTTWVAVSNVYSRCPIIHQQSSLRSSIEFDDLLKNTYPSFEVVKISCALRYTDKILETLQHGMAMHDQAIIKTEARLTCSFNEKLIETCSRPSNLTEGITPIRRNGRMKIFPIGALLQNSLSNLINEFVLFIIDDTLLSKTPLSTGPENDKEHPCPMPYELMPPYEWISRVTPGITPPWISKKIWKREKDHPSQVITDLKHNLRYYTQKFIKCQNCLKNLDRLMIDFSIQSIGRPAPIFHCLNFSSSEEQIKNWINGERHSDLVVSQELVNGFEDQIVISINGGDVSSLSRSASKYEKIDINNFLNMISIFNHTLGQKEEHDCEAIFDYGASSDLETFTMASFISKYILFFRNVYFYNCKYITEIFSPR